MASTIPLSLLSRGVGEVQKNGHEKVEVKLEPEDYYNWAEHPDRLYLPPLAPKYAFESPRSNISGQSPRELHEVQLPKTFTTRKGALFLFSEDLASSNRERRYRKRRRKRMTQSMDDIDLNTVEDLARSILAYGGSDDANINLKFVREAKDSIFSPRQVRPGFSARRYLASWTKSFDDSFINKLTEGGFLHESTLMETNPVLPHLKRRINDNLSLIPGPYRLLRNMLMSPGSLGGYTFYRMETTPETAPQREDTRGLEDPGGSNESLRPDTRGTIKIYQHKDGVTQEVEYDELDVRTKQQVLTDLLVKSAINHAIKKSQEMYSDISQSDASKIGSRRTSVGTGVEGDKKLDRKFSMQDAIENLVTDSHNQILILKGSKKKPDDLPGSFAGSIKGSGISSVKSSGARSSGQEGWPQVSDKDYEVEPSNTPVSDTPFNNTPVLPQIPASVKSITPGVRTANLPPRKNAPISLTQAGKPVLPPILQSEQSMLADTVGAEMSSLSVPVNPEVPQVNIEPPTPQHSTLPSREPTNLTRVPSQAQEKIEESDNEGDTAFGDEEEEEEDTTIQWATHVDENEILKKAEKAEADRLEKQRKRSVRSASSQKPKSGSSIAALSDKDSILVAGQHFHGSTESLNASLHSLDSGQVKSAKSGFKGSGFSIKSTASNKRGVSRSARSQASVASVQSAGSSEHAQADDVLSVKGSVVMLPGGEINIGGSLLSKADDEIPINEVAASNIDDHLDSGHHSEEDELKSQVSGYSRRSGRSDPSVAKSYTSRRDMFIEEVVAIEVQSPRQYGVVSPSEGIPVSEYSVPEKSARTPSLQLDIALQPTVSPYSSLLHADDLLMPEDSQTDAATSEAGARSILSASHGMSEQELIETLTQHAAQIAASVLESGVAGNDLEEDAKAAVAEIVKRKMSSASADPTTAEYKDLLRDTLASVVGPEEYNGELPADQAGDQAGMEVVPYTGQPGILPEDTAAGGIPDAGSPTKSSKSAKSVKSTKSVQFADDKQVLEELAKEVGVAEHQKKSAKSAKSNKSNKSAKSTRSVKSNKSKSGDSEKKAKEKEFVVGKVEDKKELENLYKQPPQLPPAPAKAKNKKKAKVAASKLKNAFNKKKSKKGKKKEVKEEAEDEEAVEQQPEVAAEEEKEETAEQMSGTESPTPSHTTTESSMSFIIIRDEEEDIEEEEEIKSETKSVKSAAPSGITVEAQDTGEEEETDEEDQLKSISNKDARAAKRAAEKEKRRLQVERKRREREEQIKREKEMQERQEKLRQEMEEEKRKKDEEIRLRKEQAEREREEAEQAEIMAEKRRLADIEREKRMKEEQRRKLEELRRQQKEEEEWRREMALERERLEAEKRAREAALLAQMEAAEREEYLRKKAEEEERERIEAELRRQREEEENRLAMEEAKRLAEEMQRKKAELEARLMFNRGLQVESNGLAHTQDINKAFVWSYFEILQWLGIDIPDFEKRKKELE